MFGNDWDFILKEEIKKEYFIKLKEKIREEYQNKTIYPKAKDVFKAFRMTPYKNVRVVILGQDCYHGPRQAEGLSFSVPREIPKPKSLINIFKELESDLKIKTPSHGNLSSWAKQGVFLLNSILTVEEHKPASHAGFGWEFFTDEVIRKLNEKQEPIVFILWGNYARSKKGFITNPKHLVIESAHPSPLSASRGFFGSKPFSKTNTFLRNNGLKEINWQIED